MKRPALRRSILSGVLVLTAAFAIIEQRPAQGTEPFSADAMPAEPGLSVMTYNVEGLPWPVRFGRSADLAQIGSRLQLLRRAGRQPHVVMLQEAFSADARAIASTAGYRYVIDGPAADQPGAAPGAGDLAFEAGRSAISGERSGKLLGSGLRILSDYPIRIVRRQPFPAAACAGYDCLANKGMVMAVVAPPGRPTPIALVDVHMNARHAAGVPVARSLHAYRAQVAAIDGFLRRNLPAGMPAIVAGDFNIGQDAGRRASFADGLGHWWTTPGRQAFGNCLADAGCAATLPADARLSMARARDWQFLVAGGGYAWKVRRIAVPFGREADGTMLSDHIGYTAYYDLGRPAPRSGAASPPIA